MTDLTIADVEARLAKHVSLLKSVGAGADHAADLTALLASHRRMKEALEKVRDVHVNKHTDNVWSAAARCRKIAASALQGDAHADR